ncbi:helicase HerA domain-containing protein [Rhodoplanes roseus]|uniref:Helicase HerA central domain-containing protein n=1 Tax=Rhodoplanes roseus TaxID=29409 RepID=A0A327KDP6_9BRAD|nr:DUF87 domain-containing protein [Rhodoplanes roseus]RAI36899.1 hypothetical protein CH341_30045 [Rhodoplanes roseus]
MSRHPIPDAALDDRLGIVGMTGSGKTYGAGTCVERILAKRGRVIIPDPLGVWWGLRLLADGKTPSAHEVVVFGGPHADLPVSPQHGALIGETVAGMRESAILDLSGFETAASERRFMLAFLDALYRKATGEPVHLVFDEADLWAPERILDREGDATKLHGMMQTVVRRGRIKGLTSWLISQRPAALSKSVLSQVDGLVAFRLTASQDRKALGAWIEGQADRAEGAAMLGRLPTKARGEAVVWLPARGILSDVAFPAKATWDSSRTPKRGETRARIDLLPLDLGSLKQRLATVEAENKANDPKALRAELARLQRELREASAKAAQNIQNQCKPDPDALADAERRGYSRGEAAALEAWRQTDTTVGRAIDHLMTCGEQLRAMLEKVRADMAQRVESRATVASSKSPSRAEPAPAPAPATSGRPLAAHRPPAGAGIPLPRAERLILSVLAQYPDGRAKNQIAILTGYAVDGGGFNNAISAARSAGRLEGSGDRLRITDRGLADLGAFEPLPTGHALLQHWLGKLGKAERAALSGLAEIYPRAMSKDDLAARAGYEPSGGGFNNALSRLRTLELIEGRGELRASDALFG